MMKNKEVHSGVIHKVGGKIKTWNRRWMILWQDFTLKYYKEPAKPPLGSISLHDPKFDVRQGTRNDTAWAKTCTGMECTLVITTTSRTYYMFTESKDDADMWIQVLSDARVEIQLRGKNSTLIGLHVRCTTCVLVH